MSGVVLEEGVKAAMAVAKETSLKFSVPYRYMGQAVALEELRNKVQGIPANDGSIFSEDRPGRWVQSEVPILRPGADTWSHSGYDDPVMDAAKSQLNKTLAFAALMDNVALPIRSDYGMVDFWSESSKTNFGWSRSHYFANQASQYADYLFSLATGDLSAQINTLANPMLAGLEEERRREVARAQTKYTAANGFFNSGIAQFVADIDHRYAVLKAEKLTELASQFRREVYALANNLANTLLNYRNPTIADALSIEQHRLMATLELNKLQHAGVQSGMQQVMTTAAYLKEEANRMLFNSKQVWDRKLNLSRWEAEYLSILANVGGNGQGGSAGLMETITNMAMGGLQVATGVAALATGNPFGAVGVGSGVAQLGAAANTTKR